MTKLARFWAGRLFGTNTGNLFAELDSTDSAVKGTIRFLDERFGAHVFGVVGTFDGTNFELSANPAQVPDGVTVGEIEIKGTLTPDGTLRGRWSSTHGTGGVLVLHPHEFPTAAPSAPSGLPEQLHTASRTLGVVRLYADDVRELIGFLKRDFGQGRVVVTYRERGNEKSIYASDFENEIPRLGTLRYLKLHIQEPEAYGIYRLATVELNATGTNDVRVQGIQESWVTGKAESLAGFIREREKSVTSTLKKYGLNVNGILLVAALIALPELSLSRRAIFTVAVFAIIAVIAYLHSRLIPNALIYLSAPKPNLFQRIWPPTLSWLFTIGGAVIGAIIYGLLKGEISVPGWLHFW